MPVKSLLSVSLAVVVFHLFVPFKCTHGNDLYESIECCSTESQIIVKERLIFLINHRSKGLSF